MAKFKRDEVRTFGFLWLITGGVFAALSLWAVYNDAVTRAPWQREQKEFFRVEVDQAQRNYDRTLNLFNSQKTYDGGTKTAQQKVAELDAQLKATLGQKNAEPYAGAAKELKQLDEKYAAAEQDLTFAKSDADEGYYYRTLSDYERDEAEGKARKKLVEKYGEGNGHPVADKAFLDPPLGIKASVCPERLVAAGGCVDLLHNENEVARNKAHAAGARAAAATYPEASEALLAAAKKADETVARLENEIKHQKRIDISKGQMLEIDDKRKAAKAKMAPVDSKVEELEREIAKIKRPLDDAERRLQTAKDRANPKFDVAHVIDSLVGVHEINQIVTDWNGKMQVDRCTTCHMGADSGNYADLTVPRKFRTHPMRNQLFSTHPVEKFGCTSCHLGQGRATEASHAHSQWKLEDHHGEARWHLTGDHYWEEPMLPIGELHRVVVDARNDTMQFDASGKMASVTIPTMEYLTEEAYLGTWQAYLQAELAKNGALAPHWRVRVVKVDNRVQIGLEPISKEAEAVVKKPIVRIKFPKPELAEVLGFTFSPNVAGNAMQNGELKCQTWCIAPLPAMVPVRNDDPVAADGKWTPPSGRNGLQVPPEYRDRFIQSLPETESGCTKCHAGDTDMRPHKAKGQWIQANREKALREVAVAACKTSMGKACDANDAACAAHRDECTKLMTSEPIDPGPDPEKLADMAPTASEGRNLFKRLNCTGCHILDGFPGNRNAGPQLNAISAKVSPKWLLQWIRYPRAWRAKTKMPNLWPVPVDPESKRPYPEGSAEYTKWEQKMRAETLAITAFLWERSEHPELQKVTITKDWPAGPIPPAEKPLKEKVEAEYSEAALTALGSSAEEGGKIFETVGCKGCHALGEDEPGPWKVRERDIAPNLGSIGTKSTVPFLAYWIEDPTRYWNGTHMPSLRLTKAEAGSVAMFLATQKTEAKAPAHVGDDELKKLSDGESRKALAKQGAGLVAEYGCFGCHQIAGYEAYAPIAPELNGFLHKDTHTLDFGYAITDHHQQTWETFTVWKLDSPRIYRTDRIELKMGDYDLSPREIRALMVFLKGLAEEQIKPALKPEDNANYKAMMEGRNLVEEYNCKGCHLIEGLGNDIQAAIKKGPVGLQQSDDDLNRQYGPPSLTAEGARVQPEWFYKFLHAPGDHPIRPFLHPEKFHPAAKGAGAKVPDNLRAVRMPTFPLTSEKITSIIRYFAQWEGAEYPFHGDKPQQLAPDHKLSALVHFNSNDDQGVRCVQCHYVGSISAERATADWKALAPNLGAVSTRLRPAWTKTWIENPPDFLPYTKMPPLWTDTSGAPAMYGPPKAWTKPAGITFAMADDQIALLRDFIFALQPNSELPPAGQEEGSPLLAAGPVSETAAAEADKKEGKDGKDKDKAAKEKADKEKADKEKAAKEKADKEKAAKDKKPK